MVASDKSNIVADGKIAKIKLKKDKVYLNMLSLIFWKEAITNCINMCQYCWKQIYVGGKILWCWWKNIKVYEAIKVSQLVIPSSWIKIKKKSNTKLLTCAKLMYP